MEITWFGQAAFKLKTKTATIIIDPFDPSIGLAWPQQEADLLLMSHDHNDHHYAKGVVAGFTIDGPGEYEVRDVSVTGTRLYHDATKGSERGVITAYTLIVEGLTICHLSDLGHELTSEQAEDLANPDILMIPVGGHYTIDGAIAAKVVSQLEPRMVIPMHYQIPGLSLPTELADVDAFLAALGKEAGEVGPSLKVVKEALPEEMRLVVLEPRKS
jgi:L-ascorbate metabolism protein UlaG (beta-lactamase superfamily)